MVQRPKNPRAQGKVKRSHRVLLSKIHYDMMNLERGCNWVKNLPNYMLCLNNEKHKALGRMSPFEVYFGRKNYGLASLECLSFLPIAVIPHQPRQHQLLVYLSMSKQVIGLMRKCSSHTTDKVS